MKYNSIAEWIIELKKINDKEIKVFKDNLYLSQYLTSDEDKKFFDDFIPDSKIPLKYFNIQILDNLNKDFQNKMLDDIINYYELGYSDFFLIYNMIVFNQILKQQYMEGEPYKKDRYIKKLNTKLKTFIQLEKNFEAVKFNDLISTFKSHLSPSDNIHFLYHRLEYVNLKSIDINYLLQLVTIDNYKNEFKIIKPSPNSKKLYRNVVDKHFLLRVNKIK